MIRIVLAASFIALMLSGQVRAQPAYQACVTPGGTVEASRVCKAAPGVLWGWQVTTGATGGYVMIFDGTTDPADGSITAGMNMKYCVQISSNSTIGNGPGLAESYVKGIVFVFSSTGCTTKTESATAWFRGVAQ